MSPNRFSLLLIIVTVLLALSWLLFAKAFELPNMPRAYHGTGPPTLNKLIRSLTHFRTGSDINRTLNGYVRKWHEITWRLLLAVLVGGTVAVLVTRPELQRLIESWRRVSSDRPAKQPESAMSRPRLWLVQSAIVVIVLGAIAPIVTGIEYWPFSHYRMYAQGQAATVARYRFFGITADGGEVAITRQYMLPFDDSRLPVALRRLKRRKQGAQAYKQAMHDVLDRYERRRLAGAHDGPRFYGIKLYRFIWTLTAGASNVYHPDTKQLIDTYGGR